jgi:hypothetical protein
MASVKGENITILDTKPVVYPSAADWGGALRVQHDTYEASALSSGSTITVARLPKGAIVHGFHIQHDALGSGVTLALGVAGATTRYMGATAAATAGHLGHETDGAIGGIGVALTEETDIVITTGGAAATGTIECQVFYALSAG